MLYVLPLQPHRTLVYLFGALVDLGFLLVPPGALGTIGRVGQLVRELGPLRGPPRPFLRVLESLVRHLDGTRLLWAVRRILH